MSNGVSNKFIAIIFGMVAFVFLALFYKYILLDDFTYYLEEPTMLEEEVTGE